MKPLEDLRSRARALTERVDRLSARERALVFGAGVALLYAGWQMLVMDPLAARAKAADRRLGEVSQRAAQFDAATAGDPLAQALARRGALESRLAELDAELREAAGGYVPPERMAELLRDVLERRHGLRLVALRNLPVEDAGAPAGGTSTSGVSSAAGGTPAAAGEDAAAGPFVHPVELVVEGDYPAIVAYLQALEALPWRVQWRRLDLAAGEWPTNRLRIEVATFALTRDWLSV